MSSQHLVLTMDAYFLMHDIIAIMRLFFFSIVACLLNVSYKIQEAYNFCNIDSQQ